MPTTTTTTTTTQPQQTPLQQLEELNTQLTEVQNNRDAVQENHDGTYLEVSQINTRRANLNALDFAALTDTERQTFATSAREIATSALDIDARHTANVLALKASERQERQVQAQILALTQQQAQTFPSPTVNERETQEERNARIDATAERLRQGGDTAFFSQRDATALLREQPYKLILRAIKRNAAVERSVTAEVFVNEAGEIEIPPNFLVFGNTTKQERAFQLTGASNSSDGNAIATTMTQLILRPQTILNRLPVTIIQQKGLVRVPFVQTFPAPTKGYTAENAAANTADGRIQSLSLSPNRITHTVNFTSELELTQMNINQVITMELERVLGLNMDYALLFSTGNNAEGRRSLLYTANLQTQSLGAAGGALTEDALNKLFGSVIDADGSLETTRWVSTMSTILAIEQLSRSLNTGGSNLISQSNVDGVMQKTLIGSPIYNTSLVPRNLTKSSGNGLTALLVGDWRLFNVASFGGVRLIRDNITGAASGLTKLTASIHVDGGTNFPRAFGVISDIKL